MSDQSRSKSKPDREYLAFLSAVGIETKRDPFPVSAPTHEVDYWADNKGVLSQLIRAEGDALIFPSSRIHAFYGPLGGGKSFAVSYLAHPKTRRVLMKYLPEPYRGRDFLAFSIAASYPLKIGMLTRGVYVGVFKKLFSEVLKSEEALTDFRKNAEKTRGPVGEALRDALDRIVLTLDAKINTENVERSEGYKLLTLERSKLGSLKTQDDYVSGIRAVAEPLMSKFQRVLVAVDELETLRQVSASERLFFNDFVRKLHQEVSTGLTLILILSLNTFEDVQAVLLPAVVSRISENINFGYVRNKKDIVDYVNECFEKGAGVMPASVIELEAVEAIASDLIRGRKNRDITFREVNMQLHRIFASLLTHRDVQTPFKVTLPSYEAIKQQVPVEEIIRDLG